MNIVAKKNVGGGGYLSLQFTVHHWGKPGQEIKAGREVATVEDHHLQAYFRCSMTFLLQLLSTCPGVMVLMVSCAPLHYSAIKKISQRRTHRQSWWKKFYSWRSFFPGVLTTEVMPIHPLSTLTHKYRILKHELSFLSRPRGIVLTEWPKTDKNLIIQQYLKLSMLSKFSVSLK